MNLRCSHGRVRAHISDRFHDRRRAFNHFHDLSEHSSPKFRKEQFTTKELLRGCCMRERMRPNDSDCSDAALADSPLGTLVPTPSFCLDRQALYRRYGRFFAEFLKDDSLVPLRLLASPTSGGLRYGNHTLALTGFSWKTLQKRLPGKNRTFMRPRPEP